MYAIFVGSAVVGTIMIIVIHNIDVILSLSIFGGVAILMAVALIVRTATQCNGNANGSTNSNNGSTSDCCRRYCVPLCILLISIALGFGILIGVKYAVITVLTYEVYREVYMENDWSLLYTTDIAYIIFGIVAFLMIIVFIMRAVKRYKTNTKTRKYTHSLDLSIYLVGVALGYGIICGIRAIDHTIFVGVVGSAVILGIIIAKCRYNRNNAYTINNNPGATRSTRFGVLEAIFFIIVGFLKVVTEITVSVGSGQ